MRATTAGHSRGVLLATWRSRAQRVLAEAGWIMKRLAGRHADVAMEAAALEVRVCANGIVYLYQPQHSVVDQFAMVPHLALHSERLFAGCVRHIGSSPYLKFIDVGSTVGARQLQVGSLHAWLPPSGISSLAIRQNGPIGSEIQKN